MLIIGSEQWAALATSEHDKFVEQLTTYARTRHPDRFWRLSASDCRSVILRILAMAASHGLPSERAGVLFVDLVADFGTEFPKGNGNEWARAILERRNIDADHKTALLAAIYDDSGDTIANDAATGRYSITDEPRP